MMLKHTTWSVIVALAAVAALLLAPAASANGAADPATDPVGTAAFLDIGMGARPLGMGGAFVALADDGNAVYYNPAGLALVEGHNVTSMYSTVLGAGSYMGVGYSQKDIGVGALRLSSTATGTDEYGNPTAEFGYSDTGLMCGYAHAFGNVAIGGGLKLYFQELSDNNGRGFTGDVGVLAQLPFMEGLRVGAVARNLVGDVKYKSGSTDSFDRKFIVGMALKPLDKLTIAADYDITGTAGHIGAEYQVIPAVAIRAGGIIGKSGESGFTAGIGFALHGFSVDYAYQTHTVQDSHWLSVGFSF